MQTGTFLKASYFFGLVLTIYGALVKILHESDAEPFLIGAVIAGLLFIGLAIYEIRSSPFLTRWQKTAWTLGFICCSGLAGLLYLFVERKRIVGVGK